MDKPPAVVRTGLFGFGVNGGYGKLLGLRGLGSRAYFGYRAVFTNSFDPSLVSDTISINTSRVAMSILKVSIRQVKAARALLGWSQKELADASGVSEPTIKRLEAVDGDLGGRAETAGAIQSCIEAAGIQFIPENGAGAGVRLAKRKGESE